MLNDFVNNNFADKLATSILDVVQEKLSDNPQMVLMEMLVLVGGFNAAKIGLDRWIIPFLRSKLVKKEEKTPQQQTVSTA